MLALSVVGVGLVVFGALVLLKFPDRPGGTIAWRGMEVNSAGAGLPIIVVGVLALALSALGSWGNKAPLEVGGPARTEAGPSPKHSASPVARPATAEDAAVGLLRAWQAGDRNAALVFADADVVEELLAQPVPRVRSESKTCGSAGAGRRYCVFQLSEGGEITFRMAESDEGWRVERAD